MGLGRLLTRNLQYDVTNTETGATASYEVVIDKGIYADWSSHRYRGAMTVPAAWRASLIISDLIGSLPWNAYRRRGGISELLDPTPPLLDQPNPEEERVNTFSAWALDLVYHGNALGIVAARNAYGVPTAVLPVPADICSARRVGPGAYAGGLPVGQIEYNIGGQSFDPSDIIHIKGPCPPGDLRGMGVLEMHLSGSLELAGELQRQAGSVQAHGVPTGVLKVTNPDTTSAEMTDAKQAWLKAQRDRTIAVLNSVTDFTPLSWNPEQMQLVEARKFSLAEMALVFGLPGYFLGAETTSMTYSNITQEGMNLLRFHLNGHLSRFEQALSRALPRGTQVKADLDSLLRPDTMARYQAYQVGLAAKFLDVDEVRESEDLPPLPEPPAPPQLPVPDDTQGGDTTDGESTEEGDGAGGTEAATGTGSDASTGA